MAAARGRSLIAVDGDRRRRANLQAAEVEIADRGSAARRRAQEERGKR
jgi:hypothetical protein